MNSKHPVIIQPLDYFPIGRQQDVSEENSEITQYLLHMAPGTGCEIVCVSKEQALWRQGLCSRVGRRQDVHRKPSKLQAGQKSMFSTTVVYVRDTWLVRVGRNR